MKDLKLIYLALTSSVGAVVLCGVSSMLSVFPNSSKIDSLTHQVEILTEANNRLAVAAAAGGENRMRINELDIGMTALANVMKIDRPELAKAIAAVKTSQEDDASTALASPSPTQQVSAVAPSSVRSLGQHQPDPTQAMAPASAAATANPAPVQEHTQTAAAEQPEKLKPNSASLPTPGSHSGESAPLLGADNPFDAPSDRTSAGGEVPPALEVAASKAMPTTIAEVDAVLGKRLSANWYKPAGAADDLSTIVQLKMSRDGKVATVRLSKSSGNSAFDNSAINAVKSIGAIDEVRLLSDADFHKAYASRSIQFTPQMGG